MLPTSSFQDRTESGNETRALQGAALKPHWRCGEATQRRRAMRIGRRTTRGLERDSRPLARATALLALALSACGAPTAAHHTPHGDRVPHAHTSAQAYAAMLDDPARDAWQMPARLVAALGVGPGARVADVGTGSGYFLPYLDRAVAPGGRVVGEDIDPELLAIAQARAQREGLRTVEVRRGAPEDPGLEPGAYDLVLLVDTYHHVENRPVFLAHVRRALGPGGRFVVVDFREGSLPIGPPPEHKIARAQIEQEARAAGLALARTEDFLPYQFVLEFTPDGGGASDH